MSKNYYLKLTLIFFIINSFILSSCSINKSLKFAHSKNVSQLFKSIQIKSSQNKHGTLLNNHLYKLFNYELNIKPKYKLLLSEKFENFTSLLNLDSSNLTKDTKLNVKFSLIDLNSNKIIYKGEVNCKQTRKTNYSPYISHRNKIITKKDLIKRASHLIYQKLLLYFNRSNSLIMN